MVIFTFFEFKRNLSGLVLTSVDDPKEMQKSKDAQHGEALHGTRLKLTALVALLSSV
jgi:hypothetical protein